MTNPLRKPSTAIHWYPHSSATESAVIDMANSRQIALRTRLRNHYWLTECKPISPVTVALTRKKMILIDTKDKMSDTDVTEILSSHYGFHETPEGLTIPELDEARGVVIKSGEMNRINGAKGGIQKAINAATKATPSEPLKAEPVGNPTDF